MRKGAFVTNENEVHAKAHHVKRSFAIVTILFFLTLVGFSWLLVDVRDLSQKNERLTKATAHLTIENTKRIDEIQNSRVSSCKKTYEGIQDVFRTFFPKKLTDAQKKILAKFDRDISRLVRGCEKQTRPISKRKRNQ